MFLTSISSNGESFGLYKASETDALPIIELMANDPLRQGDYPEPSENLQAYIQAFRAIDTDPAQLLVAVKDSRHKLVATMQLTIIPGLSRGGSTRMLIEAVRVDASLRGKGIGSSMIVWAVAEAKRRGASLVQLTSDNTRTRAHQFYKKLGFTASHIGFKLKV